MRSEWQPFGYDGGPGTCLWCGRRLPRETVHDARAEEQMREAGLTGPELWRASLRPALKTGRYQDGVFCGLRCGYQFGKRMAELGHRLEAAT